MSKRTRRADGLKDGLSLEEKCRAYSRKQRNIKSVSDSDKECVTVTPLKGMTDLLHQCV